MVAPLITITIWAADAAEKFRSVSRKGTRCSPRVEMTSSEREWPMDISQKAGVLRASLTVKSTSGRVDDLAKFPAAGGLTEPSSDFSVGGGSPSGR